MASVAKRPNGRYRARYRDDTGREHSKDFMRKSDAQVWVRAQASSVDRGDHVNPKDSRTSVTAYAGQWQAVQVGRPASLAILDNALRLHVLPTLGGKSIGAVRRSDVQSLVKALEAKGLAPGTIRNVYDATARLFAAAVDDRVIPTSPCRRVVLPKSTHGEVTPLRVEQVYALAEGMGNYRALVVLMAGSGLRIGEALGLEVPDVNFLRRTIRVERQRLQSGELGPPKSAQSARTVPVGQVVIDTLAGHLTGRPSVGPLFLDGRGEPLNYRQFKRLWSAATARAQVAATAHDLRHFYASALIAGGASVRQVQSCLGHASAVITLRVYAHLWPGDDDRTRTIIDSVLGAPADILRPAENS